ncbi:MAG: DMT family transporter [Spirochaetales bacterium]|nr:DMT family transporter [Spirochaetales bacterium]
MPRNLSRFFPWAALVASVGLWGVSFIFTKLLLAELPAVTIAWFRLGPALLVLGALMWRRKEKLSLSRGDFVKLVLASGFGIVLYMVLENNGLRFTSASTASLLVASIPLFVLIVEAIVRRQRLPAVQLLAIAVSLVGVWLVLFNGLIPRGQAGMLGNVLILGAMGSWIVYTFVARDLGQRYSGLKQTTLQSLFALVLYLPFLFGDFPKWRPVPLNSVLELLFLGIFCSGLAYVGYLYAINRLGTVIPSAFLNLIPVVTVFSAWLILKETPGLGQFVGAILVITSLLGLTRLTRPRAGP